MDEDGGFFKCEESTSSQIAENDDIIIPVSKENTCSHCGGIPLSSEMKNVFGVHICKKCQYSKLKFITKTRCKEDYMLTDEEISQFKYLTRPNPHKGSWNDMQLYIETQIADFSLSKYGSVEKIEENKQLREENNKKIKVNRIKQKIKEMKKKTFLKPEKQQHIHKFVKNGKFSICKCGMKIEQEEL